MAKWRAIFFDVGNTLLFPNRAEMLAPLPLDRQPTLEQWQALERRTKQEFDQAMLSGNSNYGFWRRFHSHLLDQIGNHGVENHSAILDSLVRNAQNSALWDQILPGTGDVLQRMAQNFRIAVISNADGKVDRTLSRCGISECFESITDSGAVGCEKPQPEIFHAALATINARPEESLYVGDVYSVDYVGAHNAGMDAVLLDVAGAYRDRNLPRVESLQQLENWLQEQR
jgi:HAD superfamily hydrolase (TIGR01549 family)